MPFYEWQRPSPLYKRTLLHRQNQLRKCRLDQNEELLTEWLAILAELDRLLREEYSSTESASSKRLANLYYKQVLIARQEQLRHEDLESDNVLLMEWCMLVKELDAIVRDEHNIKEADTTRDLRHSIHKATSTTIINQDPKPSNQQSAIPVPSEAPFKPHSKVGLPGETPDAESITSTSSAADHHDSRVKSTPHWLYSESDDEQDGFGSEFNFQPDAHEFSPYESSRPPSLENEKSTALALDYKSLSLEQYATLPPSAKLKALCVPNTSSIDTEKQGLEAWRPPSPSRIAESALPAWLTGLDDDDDTDGGLSSETEVSDFASDVGGSGVEVGGSGVDPRKLSELELKRQLLEKDAELRLVELQLELETAKNLVGSTANKISEASDSGEKANLQMELVEAQLDLDWKEKEFKADQLKHELHEMENTLEKARLGILNDPEVGEILDRNDLIGRLAEACTEPEVALELAASVIPENQKKDVAVTKKMESLTLIPGRAAQAHNAMLMDKACADDIALNLAKLRKQAEEKAEKMIVQEQPIDEVDEKWRDEQLQVMQKGQHVRSDVKEKIKTLLEATSEGKEERTLVYNTKAKREFKRQLRLAEKRLKKADEEAKQDAARRKEEMEEMRKKKEEYEARVRIFGEEEAKKRCVDIKKHENGIKAEYWSDQVKVIEKHIEKKLQAMTMLNKMTLQATGKVAIEMPGATPSGEQDASADIPLDPPNADPDWL
eukprot:m.32839 g.32839  ORF g.32839 m.32839 type:complete len:724 (+) comp8457_c0_seq1:315-2486(+)